jgi:hypothetical protein
MTRTRPSAPRPETQKKNRRKNALFRKAAEYSLMCNAYVFVFLRIETTGQTYVFNSDPSRWPPSKEQLASKMDTVIFLCSDIQ